MEVENKYRNEDDLQKASDYHTEAFKLMDDAGMKIKQKLRVKYLIKEWAKIYPDDVEKDCKHDVWKNKNIPRFYFDEEGDAVFAGALKKYMGSEYDDDEIIKVHQFIDSMLGKSGYKFVYKKSEKF